MSRPLLVLVMLLGVSHADAEGPKPLRLVALASGLALHVVTGYVIQDHLAPDRCRWCAPPGFDASVRERVVWDDRKRASRMSDVTGYLAVPLVAAGGFAISARDVRCPGRRWWVDALPVLESAIYTQLFTQLVKYSVGRQRPAVRFDGTNNPSSEDNLSFFSGHTTLAFSVAVSSGMVAHRRGYQVEPAIWISTLALATTTAYLRMAADRHYLSDALFGAVIGSAGGYLIPHLGTRFGERATLVPTPNGVAIAGML